MIDFFEMSELYNSIGFIDYEIFQVLEIVNLIFKEFMNTAWCTDYNVRFALTNDTELLLFWHTTDNGDNRDFALNMTEDLSDIFFNLLS